MDYRDLYLGFYRDYYRDPFPQSLQSTREIARPWGFISHAVEGLGKYLHWALKSKNMTYRGLFGAFLSLLSVPAKSFESR